MIRAALCLAALSIGGAALAQGSLSELERAADEGVPAAQRALAERLLSGDGLLPNYARAAELLRAAAAAGDPAAQNRLGQMLHDGLGVPQDRAAALRWFASAAEAGQPEHLHDYATVLEADDPARAAELYARAAETGHVPSMTSLGVLLQDGRGVAQDPAAARLRYEAASAAGDMRATNNLGLLYVRGDGVAQDYAKAFALFTEAAEAGSRQAMTNLGVMYENGFGTAVDEARAAELYRMGAAGPVAGSDPGLTRDPRLLPVLPDALDSLRQSAQAGDPIAEYQLALLLAEQGDFAALREAATLFRAAAEAGHGPSMANLGRLYFLGLGVPQDFVLGQMWLLLAQRAGTDTAALALAFGKRPTNEQIAEAQSRAMARLE
ncbi:tetratricopeptide repeat protein [Jannaschia seohaensis]|uniref:TPR repeat n=1 Tax=Jannaschia seohaensis TaxID=475081 RepID=A0A2Y9AZ64_9RHOB|nr:SEL1-like repeat protein [Jannaschia seohaensis]PWJ15788.1 hypothetical protein BCF38_1108 [Jannaschia seohaensis]SSA49471.1 hypothetical protein SAMN05421539_1108 [Jannaschia seohaensis]